MQVDVSLGYGDTEREAMKWMMIHQMLAADPAMQSQYGPEQRYGSSRRSWSCAASRTWTTTSPRQKAQPPQPDPIAMAELELKKTEAATKQQQELDVKEAESKRDLELRKIALDEKKCNYEHQIALAELELKAEDAARR